MVTINVPGRANEYEYKGLSTDSKPADCAENSLFLELDTGDFYYFTGDSWEKLGAGGGGDDPDVLFKGTLTLVAMEGTYVANETPFTMTSDPEDNDPVYMYADNNLIANGTWSKEQGTSGYYYEFSTDDAGIDYQDGEGSLWISGTSLTGNHLIEIRKSAKS